jgi:hypothetical protein
LDRREPAVEQIATCMFNRAEEEVGVVEEWGIRLVAGLWPGYIDAKPLVGSTLGTAVVADAPPVVPLLHEHSLPDLFRSVSSPRRMEGRWRETPNLHLQTRVGFAYRPW